MTRCRNYCLALLLAIIPSVAFAAAAAEDKGPPAAPENNTVPKNNPGHFFGVDHYPAEALRNREQGRVVARLLIDATGTPTKCVIATSSGSPSLDAGTCNIALTKVHFTPARDDAGHAVASTYSLSVRWVLP